VTKRLEISRCFHRKVGFQCAFLFWFAVLSLTINSKHCWLSLNPDFHRLKNKGSFHGMVAINTNHVRSAVATSYTIPVNRFKYRIGIVYRRLERNILLGIQAQHSAFISFAKRLVNILYRNSFTCLAHLCISP